LQRREWSIDEKKGISIKFDATGDKTLMSFKIQDFPMLFLRRLAKTKTPSTSRGKLIMCFDVSITQTPKDSNMGIYRRVIEKEFMGCFVLVERR